jgi:hypothetical protein
MNDYDTLTLLSRLPPRERHSRRDAVVDYSTTNVEAFVRDAVATDSFPAESMEAVMDALFAADIAFPVALADLKRIQMPLALKKEERLFAKLLTTLNGPAIPLVSVEQLRTAAHRESVMATMADGWGTTAAHAHVPYLCKLLLLSVGVHADVLPPIKSVPSPIKQKINAAWRTACAAHGWAG